MTPERYAQIGEIYQAALAREPLERLAFLAEACGSDGELQSEVESLIAAYEQADGFIEQPPADVAAGWHAAAGSLQGQSLAQYQFSSLLGKGGMGEVWLAKDTRLGRNVAVKLLPVEFTTDDSRVRRFTQEARAASALNHPNILTIHEIGTFSDGSATMHYIVTEYIEGETLRERIRRMPGKRLPLAIALDIATQIATALTPAHEAGIIHRDIKPENVMVRRDGIIKILDFGLAKLIEDQHHNTVQGSEEDARLIAISRTKSGMVMGTPHYMSPEQARGEIVDARSDIFSLGAVLYEIVVGQPPFAGASISEIMAAILRDESPPLPNDQPRELQSILSKALSKDCSARYQTATEFFTDLAQLKQALLPARKLIQSPASETIISREMKVARSITKRRFLLLTIIGVGIILTIVATATWLYFNRTSALASKDTILLADFDNKTGDDIFDETLKQGLATQLEQSQFLNVFPEVRVQQTLRQMERAADTHVTPALAQEICERQNLKAFITGAIAPLGSHYVIMLTALQGSNGEELTRVQATATSKEQVLQALADAATQLRTQLGESLSSIQQSEQPLHQAMTANLPALKAYSAGRNLNISGRNGEAIPFLRRAAELDPQFTEAYDMLVISCLGTEQPEAAAEYQAKVVRLQEEKAAQSKYPVSEDSKLDIDTWYQRLVTGNLNKSRKILLVRRQLSPSSRAVLNDLGLDYVITGQSEQALAPLNECIRLTRNFAAPYKWLAHALIRLNRFAEAKDTLTQALQLKLEMTAYHTQLYQLVFINTDTAGLQQQVDWARGKPDEYVALDWQTNAATFAGQWRQAQDFSRHAIELAARGDNRELAAKYATEQALRSAVLGDCQMSKTSAAQGLTFGRGRLPLARAALAQALCGAASQAQALASELTRRFPEDTLCQEIWLPLIRAAVELQRGNAAQAVEQLKNITRYEAVAEFWPQHLRGQAYLKLGLGAAAAAEFRKIIDHRGYAPLSLLYPLAHLGLARATQNRQAYQDFFVMWKDAEDDLPLLRAARHEAERK